MGRCAGVMSPRYIEKNIWRTRVLKEARTEPGRAARVLNKELVALA
jgi:hypothetical protein